jgi:phosphodiesterase/alkaline phosphatase D-like protein
MTKNLIIGVLVVAAVLVGGYFLLKNAGMPNNGSNSTSTPVATTSNPAINPSPTPVTPQNPGVPAVQTYNNGVPSNSTVVVSGQVNPNGAVTGYWYDYGTGTALGTRTFIQTLGSGFIDIPAPAYITGLKANTTYYFRLSAQNRFGTVNGATYSFQTNNNPPPQGSVPVAITTTATNVSNTIANLNGQVNPKGSVATYWFEYGDTVSLGSVTAFQSTNTGSNLINVSVALSGLKPLTKYYFRLNAQNQYGTVLSSVLNFTTKGPASSAQPTVSTGSATNIATSSATLNGRVNPNGVETRYWFEYSLDPLLANIIGTVSPAQLLNGAVTVSVFANTAGLRRNTKYYYRLGASNSNGSVNGSIASFKTKP